MGGPLEGDVVVHVSEPLRRERALGQWQVGDDEQIQDAEGVSGRWGLSICAMVLVAMCRSWPSPRSS